jgi:hypothetical protein
MICGKQLMTRFTTPAQFFAIYGSRTWGRLSGPVSASRARKRFGTIAGPRLDQVVGRRARDDRRLAQAKQVSVRAIHRRKLVATKRAGQAVSEARCDLSRPWLFQLLRLTERTRDQCITGSEPCHVIRTFPNSASLENPAFGAAFELTASNQVKGSSYFLSGNRSETYMRIDQAPVLSGRTTL